MKKCLLALIFCVAGMSTLASAQEDPLKRIRKAIEFSDLTKVKSEFRKLELATQSGEEWKKIVEDLLKEAQDIVDDPPMIGATQEPSGSQLVKSIGGVFLLINGLPLLLGSLFLALVVKRPDDAQLANEVNSRLAVLGITGAALTHLGGWLLWSARNQDEHVSSLEKAKAIEQFLEKELTYL